MDGKIPLFIITPDGKTREKVLDLLAGCNISGTPTVLFTGSTTPAVEKLATHIVRMPEVEDEYLTPFLYVFPLWFFGYHVRKMENGLVGEKRFGPVSYTHLDVYKRQAHRKDFDGAFRLPGVSGQRL